MAKKSPSKFESKVPLRPGEQRLIISTCEKGSVEDVSQMREIKAGLDAAKKANPNFVEIAAREVWKSPNAESVADPIPARGWTASARKRIALQKNRKKVRFGIPRVLNMYQFAPIFSGYLESLDIPCENLVYSDYTSGELYRAGSSRGSIDPCFPSKIGIPHIFNLIYSKHVKKPLDYILFPMIDVLRSPIVNAVAHNACPTVTVTPETAKAAYTKESDLFAERGIQYLHPLVNLNDRRLFAEQMFQCMDPLLGLSLEENDRAVEQGFLALDRYENRVRKQAREILDQLEQESRVGIVMLARSYHHDPGINHGILEEFQKLGYPVFSQNFLPLDEDMLERLFGEDVRTEVISDPLDITDVWKTCYSASTNQKVWAAKFTARHPNLVALEVSNFKCGHDAPVYSVIEEIIEQSGTPYFSFKDMDENKAAGSIKIRVETIHYFLNRFTEDLAKKKVSSQRIDEQLAEFERKLRAEWKQSGPSDLIQIGPEASASQEAGA